MGSLTLVVLLVIVIGVICILVLRKPPAKTDASWECPTCGAGNPSDSPQCDECGMDR
jgi:hypothetical protein